MSVLAWIRDEQVDGVAIKLHREDPPAFKREYTHGLPRRCRLKVTARTTMFGDRDYSGEITQPGGRWVLFDPKAPADKILDRELLPDVERLCAQIIGMDRDFMGGNPSAFTDTKGRTWQRAS